MYCPQGIPIHHTKPARRSLEVVIRRWRKKKEKRAEFGGERRKNCPTSNALKYFDNQYKPILDERWKSTRLALLSLQKYGALVNRFANAERSMDKLQSVGSEDFVQPASSKLQKWYDEFSAGGQNDLVRNSDQKWEQESEDTADLKQDTKGDDIGDEREYNVFINHPEFSEISPLAEDDDKSWKDDYIVAEGFESKLEYMVGAHHKENESPASGKGFVYANNNVIPIKINPSLKCFTHPMNDVEKFPSAKMSSSGMLQYFLMDASSVLPVVALDVQEGDKILDLCAAPGGKSLAMLQTLKFGGLVLNEISTSRLKRLERVISLYVPSDIWTTGKLQLSQEDGRNWGMTEPMTYDKVLVDAPCTTDRLSLFDKSSDNMFAQHRMKERWELPTIQEQLLCSGIQAARPGGDIVYSTCTLSPLQNDGVVQGAIRRCAEELDINVSVVDLSPLTVAFDSVFKFYSGSRYGQTVIPHISCNFGPTYFARLQRLS